MFDREIGKLSCSIFSGNIDNATLFPDIYNPTYHYWVKTWSKVFNESQSPQSLCAQNFLRQRYIIVIHREGEILGAIMSTRFDLASDATLDHPYFEPFPRDLKDHFRSEKQGSLLTGEYLSVSPEFSKKNLGFSFSDVLVGLLMEVARESQARAILATTVKPAKVHLIGFRYGFEPVGDFVKYGLDCALLLHKNPRVRAAGVDPLIQTLVDKLWNNHKKYS